MQPAGQKEGLKAGGPGQTSPGMRQSGNQCSGKEMQGRKRHFQQRLDKLKWGPDAKGTGNKRKTDKPDFMKI